MSYTTIHQCANDENFNNRLQAAAAQEGHESPEYAAGVLLRWPVSSRSDIEEAYEYALNSSNPNPGGDPTVITDQQILSAVQEILNNPMPVTPPPTAGNPLPESSAESG